MQGISRDEWMSALGEAEIPNDPSALTMTEIGELLRLGRDATKERVSRLLKEGKATKAQKWATDSAGRKIRVPAYKLVKVKR